MVQVFINIAVVIGLIPVTGVTLPFISYGGSSLVISMFMMGNQLLTDYIENIIKSIEFFYTFCLFYGIILVRRYGDIYV